MPIYEYRCQDCGHQLEALQKISDGPLKTCPECGTETLRKLVSASAFILKGSGWYVTDFKDKPKAAAKGDGEEQAKSTDAGKSDGGATKSEKPGVQTTDKGETKTGDSSTRADDKPQKKAADD